MRKRFIALWVLTVIFVQMFAVETIAADTLEMKTGFESGFEDGLSASVGRIAGTNISADTYDGRKVLRADSTSGNACFYAYSAEKAQCEATLISFDMCFDKTTTRGYMDIFGTSGAMGANDMSRGLYVTQEGTISYFESFTPPSGTRVESSLMYKTGQWYSFNMWIDYTNKRVYYFVDGVEIGCIPITGSFEGVGGFKMTVDGMNGGANYMFDNIKIINFPERGGRVALSGVAVPENFENPVTIEFPAEDNRLGFIFMGKSVTFNAVFKNVRRNTQSVSAEMTILDENRNVLLNKKKEMTLNPGAVEDLRFDASLNEFGFYCLNTRIRDANGIVLAEKELRFSAVNGGSGKLNNKVGFTDHTAYGHGLAEMERKMRLMAEAGVGRLRLEFNRSKTDYASGTYKIDEALMNQVECMSEHGIGLMAILTYGKIPPTTDSEYAEWEKYVEAIVKQLKGKNGDIVYEVWNEYNGAGFNYIGADTSDYVNLLKHTYPIIKRNDESACVNGLVVSPQNTEDNESVEQDAIDWIREVIQNGGGDYMDAASIHIYTHKMPENVSTKRAKLLSQTRAVLDEFGYTGMRIDISEIGWSTGTIVSERDMADWIVRWMAMNYGDTGDVYWYVNQEKQTASSFENRYGFTRAWTKQYAGDEPIYGAKPSFLSLSNFNSLTGGAAYEGRCDMGDADVYCYRFKDRMQNDMYILWTTESSKEAEIKTGESAAVIDVFGNGCSYEKTADGVKLMLDSSPVYVIDRVNTSKMDVYVDYNNDIVNVTGNTGGVSDEVGLTVFGVGESEVQPSDIAYVGQMCADISGDYKFSFKNLSKTGCYTVKAGFDSGIRTQEIKLTFNVPKLTVTCGGNKVEKLSQMSTGDTFTVRLDGLYRPVAPDRNAFMAVAQYENGVLADIVSVDTSTAEFSASVTGKLKSDKIDTIKIMVWDKENQVPVFGLYKID